MLNLIRKRLRKRLPFFKGRETSDANIPLTQQFIQELAGLISVPERAVSVLNRVGQFKRLSPEAQADQLAAVYLLLEQFLAEVDPLQKYSRPILREHVRAEYSSLLSLEAFNLIFRPEREQEVYLCRSLLEMCLERAYAVMGSALNEVSVWLANVPHDASLPIPLRLPGQLPQGNREWIALLRRISQSLFDLLEKNLGEQTAGRIYENGYSRLAQSYIGLETFPIVVGLLPEKLLDEEKISLLSHRQIQRALVENVDELQLINNTLLEKNEELKKTQAELIAAREEALASSTQFRAVLDTVGDGIITFEEDGRIVLVNQEVQQIWGYDQAFLTGKKMQYLVLNWPRSLKTTLPNPNGKEQVESKAETTEILGRPFEFEGIRKGGGRFPLEIKVTETKIENRILFTAAVRDITERKLAERALKSARDMALEASDLKSRLLASVSHDLRTPLNTIMGYTDMLQESVYGEPSEGQKQVLDRIMASGGQMAQLINDLLEQARVESGQVTLQLETFTPTELIEGVLTVTHLAAQQKNIALNYHIAPDVPEQLLGDKRRLQQIIVNLVSNAIKFTDHGRIDIDIFCPDPEHWGIKVSDTGCGIPAEAQATIFEPFRRGRKLGTPKRSGIGLGLSIVKQLVTLMQGDISLTSELGQGSTFIVALPQILVRESVT